MSTRPFILLDDDVIEAGDFIRPLSLVYIGQSDYLLTENTYSGLPVNHTEWLTIERAGFESWIGYTVAELNAASDELERPHQPTSRYELCRGALPAYHQMPETMRERKHRMQKQKLPCGKYKGKSLQYVQSHDPAYYTWMRGEGLDEKWCDK